MVKPTMFMIMMSQIMSEQKRRKKKLGMIRRMKRFKGKAGGTGAAVGSGVGIG